MVSDVDGDAAFADPNRGRTAEGELDPHQIAHDLARYGQEFAETNAEAKLLEEQKSIILATLIQHYRAEGKTRADAEDLAKMDQTYQDHVETMVERRRKANNANALWRAAQARLDAMRTAEATRRAEMQSFKGSR